MFPSVFPIVSVHIPPTKELVRVASHRLHSQNTRNNRETEGEKIGNTGNKREHISNTGFNREHWEQWRPHREHRTQLGTHSTHIY